MARRDQLFILFYFIRKKIVFNILYEYENCRWCNMYDGRGISNNDELFTARIISEQGQY